MAETPNYGLYLEDDASWWLIHWKISTNPEYLTAGTVLFSLLRRHEFSKIELKEYIENKIINPEKMSYEVDEPV